MSRLNDTFVSLVLIALVFSGPAALAAYWISADQGAEALMTAAAGSGEGQADASGAATGKQRDGHPVITGVLYTRGAVTVDWSGVRIPVEDGSYAYLGGETISTPPGSAGLLRLDSDNSAYMCPGSKMSLTRADDGAFEITFYEGGGRFAFAPGADFRIEANQGVVSPGAGTGKPTVVEIAVFPRHPGGVICGFSSNLDVAGYPEGGGDAPIALGTTGPGEIIDLSRALMDESASTGTPVIMQPIKIPADVTRSLQDNMPYPQSPGPIGYLCRCVELKRYSEADGIPDTAIVPRILPPDGDALVRSTTLFVAPVIPPDLPPVELAVPGVPDAADAAVLSTPSATVLTVPPPLIPVTGSGGGFSSTPS